VDQSADRRFEKKLRWLLILALLLALFFTGGNIILGVNAWAETPSDNAVVQVDVGTALVTMKGKTYLLHANDDIFVGQADTVSVGARSRAG
jgi:hypothetical protein